MVKSAIDKLKQIEVYIKYKNEIFEKNGKALSCSDKIYQVLEKELVGMTKKAIQTSINRNATKILAANEAADENDNDNDVRFEFVSIKENVEANDTFESSHPLPESFDKEDSRSEQSAEASSTANESMYALYHNQTTQDQAQKEIEQLHKGIGNHSKLFANARNEIDTLAVSNQQISSDFEASKDQLLTWKKFHAEHEEAAKEEINKLRENNQKLVSEIATLTELNQTLEVSNQQISSDFEASKDQLLTWKKFHAEHEEAAKEEINKLRENNQKLVSEIATLTELNHQISRDYEVSKNQLLASKQSCSEQDTVVATLEKHPSEPTVPTATDLVDEASTSGLKTEAHKRHWDDESCILDPNENSSSQNKRSRNRKVPSKYLGQEWLR